MPNLKPGTKIPTAEEDAKIREGIAADPDNPELTPDEIGRMRPGVEVTPKLLEKQLRDRCKADPSGTGYVMLSIDNDLLSHFLDEAGPDWHKRLNDTLRRAVFGADEA